MSAVLAWIKNFIINKDLKSSDQIFQMPKSMTMDYSLAIPAKAFSLIGYPFICMISCVMFPLCEKEVQEFKRQKSGGDENLEPMNLLDTDYYFTFVWYTINVVICGIVSRILKLVFRRKRPDKPDYDNPELKNSRSVDLRSGISDTHSFPSTEAAQAGLFSFFLMTNFPMATATLGGPIFTSQFVLSVGFSRVYFHCHYAGDALGGIIMGICLCAFIARLGLKDIVKT